MVDAIHGADAPSAGQSASKFYFIAWRWHFYAGLYVLPFLIMSATTGLIMLSISWGAGIDGERIAVTPQTHPLAIAALVESAEAFVQGGKAVQDVEPLAVDKAAAIAVSLGEGKTGVVLNPYTGEAMQTFAWRAG